MRFVKRFYYKINIDNGTVTTEQIIACVNFCKKKVFLLMFNSFKKLKLCIKTLTPPNATMPLTKIVFNIKVALDKLIWIDPFVISTTPIKKPSTKSISH